MHNSIHTNRLNIFGKFDKKREYFGKFVERKKVQLYFSFVLMPTYPLGRHMRSLCAETLECICSLFKIELLLSGTEK